MGTFSGEATILLYGLLLSHLQIWISPLFLSVGWLGGEMVLGKLLVSRGPTNLDNNRARVCQEMTFTEALCLLSDPIVN